MSISIIMIILILMLIVIVILIVIINDRHQHQHCGSHHPQKYLSFLATVMMYPLHIVIIITANLECKTDVTDGAEDIAV